MLRRGGHESVVVDLSGVDVTERSGLAAVRALPGTVVRAAGHPGEHPVGPDAAIS